MKIISVESRDIYVTFELSLSQIEQLLIALECSKIEYDGKKEPEVEEAVKYFREEFFVELDKVFETVKEQ